MIFPYSKQEGEKNYSGIFFSYLAIILSSLFLMGPLFEKGIPLLLDNPKHLSETIYLANHLLPETNWINGWCMSDFAGFPILLYHYILGKTLVALISISTGIDIVTSYKMMMLFALLFPSCTIFFLFSKFFGNKASLAAVFFFILQTSHILKISQGMWNNYFALGFLPLFVYALLKLLNSNSARYIAIASLLFALTFISHQYVAIAEVFFAFAILLSAIFSEEKMFFGVFKKLFFVGIISVALSLFYLFPFIEAGKWLSANKMFGGGEIHPIASLYHNVKILLNIPEDISIRRQLINGNLMLFLGNLFKMPFIKAVMLILDITAISGLLISFKDRGKNIAISAFLLFTLLLLIISSDLWRAVGFLNNLPFARGIENNRLILFSQFGFLFFSARGLKYLFDRVKTKKIVFGILLAVTLGGLFSLSSYLQKNNFLITSGNFSSFSQIEDFWEWTGKNVDAKSERILIQRTKGNIKDSILNESHILSLTWHYSGVNHIGAWNSGFPYATEKLVSTAQGTIFQMRENNIEEEKLIEHMSAFNTGFIAAVSPGLKEFLDKSYNFEASADFGIIKVFKLLTFKPSWIDFIRGDGAITKLSLKNNRVVAMINTKSKKNTIRIKIQNHPYWKASLDGQTIQISDDDYKLMKIRINKTGPHKLIIVYSSKALFPLFTSITALLLTILLYLLSFRKSKQSD